eukprot:scaffold194193_cov31-Tisochrysis_lutea.AAC.3
MLRAVASDGRIEVTDARRTAELSGAQVYCLLAREEEAVAIFSADITAVARRAHVSKHDNRAELVGCASTAAGGGTAGNSRADDIAGAQHARVAEAERQVLGDCDGRRLCQTACVGRG